MDAIAKADASQGINALREELKRHSDQGAPAEEEPAPVARVVWGFPFNPKRASYNLKRGVATATENGGAKATNSGAEHHEQALYR